MTTTVTTDDLQAFERDERLKQLEDALSKFNIFDAIGATHRELWHSDFLAFLLNPKQNHGLGDEFTKQLLRHAIPELSEIDSLEDVLVRREYRYTDILIEDAQQEISVIIENKIWSPEAPGQLAWYWQTIAAEHPGWSTYGVFLTPRGQRPISEDDKKRYRSISYREVKDILNDILEIKSGHIDTDVALTIRHYTDMLGRSIVNNANAEALARKIYFEHRSAISQMNPSLWQGRIKGHLENLIEADSPQLDLEVSDLKYVRFRVSEWDDAEGLKAGTNSTTSYPLLYFTFYNFEDSLTLYLWIGPSVSAEVRTELFRLVEQNIHPFCKPGKEGQYNYIYQLGFLTKSDYETGSDEALKVCVKTMWDQFMKTDLPAILQANKSAGWFWNAATS